eukprot:TRINITY_DN11724_c0_g1_i1.p1 TRINITY_DN11724_c0_g1~~TRINITY_DN11724_c0_g1_i1.p1  ORF type:complete len:417 (-),score=85.75 TRINITY_DN11724_c0_g1_i1:87-1337(-)
MEEENNNAIMLDIISKGEIDSYDTFFNYVDPIFEKKSRGIKLILKQRKSGFVKFTKTSIEGLDRIYKQTVFRFEMMIFNPENVSDLDCSLVISKSIDDPEDKNSDIWFYPLVPNKKVTKKHYKDEKKLYRYDFILSENDPNQEILTICKFMKAKSLSDRTYFSFALFVNNNLAIKWECKIYKNTGKSKSRPNLKNIPSISGLLLSNDYKHWHISAIRNKNELSSQEVINTNNNNENNENNEIYSDSFYEDLISIGDLYDCSNSIQKINSSSNIFSQSRNVEEDLVNRNELVETRYEYKQEGIPNNQISNHYNNEYSKENIQLNINDQEYVISSSSNMIDSLEGPNSSIIHFEYSEDNPMYDQYKLNEEQNPNLIPSSHFIFSNSSQEDHQQYNDQFQGDNNLFMSYGDDLFDEPNQ